MGSWSKCTVIAGSYCLSWRCMADTWSWKAAHLGNCSAAGDTLGPGGAGCVHDTHCRVGWPHDATSCTGDLVSLSSGSFIPFISERKIPMAIIWLALVVHVQRGKRWECHILVSLYRGRCQGSWVNERSWQPPTGSHCSARAPESGFSLTFSDGKGKCI